MMTDIDANKTVARRNMHAVETGDIATIEALQHPDCTRWIRGHGDIGRADFIAGVRDGLLSAQRRTAEVVGITAEGNRVAVEVRGGMVLPDRVYRNEYMDTLAVAAAFTVTSQIRHASPWRRSPSPVSAHTCRIIGARKAGPSVRADQARNGGLQRRAAGDDLRRSTRHDR